jgi:hypothetical protein
MHQNHRFFAAIVFVAIALFLAVYTWVPSRYDLQSSEGQIVGIYPQKNTWYEVEMITSGRVRLICRGRYGWPLIGPNSCPLEKFQVLQGQTITLLHDNMRPYEVTLNGKIILNYDTSKNTQRIGIMLAFLMLLMAFYVWKRE